MSQFLRAVDVLCLTLLLGLSSVASTTCESDVAGCRDEFSLIQTATSDIAALSMYTNARANIGELKRKIHTAKGQGDLLQVGDNMLRMMNATDHLSDHNQTLLGEVKSLINDTLFGNMDTEHQSNNDQLAAAAQAMQECNDDVAEKEDTGAVATRRNSTSVAREGHIQCREQELVHYTQRVANTTALFDHITAITPVPVENWQPVWKTTRDLDAIGNYFEKNQDFVDWFADASTSFTSVEDDSDSANSTHSAKQVNCDEKQTVFEEEYILYSQLVNMTCVAHGRCYTEAKNDYDVFLAEFKVVEVHHQQSYEAGSIIISKIECLLAEGMHADCSEPFIDESRYNLTEPVLPSPTECNSGAIHEACSSDFLSAEYAPPALDSNTPPAVCMTCHDSVFYMFPTVLGVCGFFNENPAGCNEPFLSAGKEACCACGGGNPVR